jgi:hypothetical protein
LGLLALIGHALSTLVCFASSELCAFALISVFTCGGLAEVPMELKVAGQWDAILAAVNLQEE